MYVQVNTLGVVLFCLGLASGILAVLLAMKSGMISQWIRKQVPRNAEEIRYGPQYVDRYEEAAAEVEYLKSRRRRVYAIIAFVLGLLGMASGFLLCING
ncbi:MAG: hypothetical protein WCV85_01545 [Patescibacteria group bacterium]|jgi:cytochrome c biogenesis protein CcdA